MEKFFFFENCAPFTEKIAFAEKNLQKTVSKLKGFFENHSMQLFTVAGTFVVNQKSLKLTYTPAAPLLLPNNWFIVLLRSPWDIASQKKKKIFSIENCFPPFHVYLWAFQPHPHSSLELDIGSQSNVSGSTE